MKEIFENFKKIKDNRNGDVVTFDFDNTVVKSFLNKTVDGVENYQFGGINKENKYKLELCGEGDAQAFPHQRRKKSQEQSQEYTKKIRPSAINDSDYPCNK